MPLLAAFLGTQFSALAALLAVYVGKRVAVAIAIIAFVGGLTAAFVVAIHGLIDTINYVVPSQLQTAANIFLPGNTVTCLGVIATAHTLQWVYSWQVRIVQYKLNF